MTRALYQGGRGDQLSQRARLHAHHRVQVSDRADESSAPASCTNFRRRKATRTIRCRARRTQQLYERYRALAAETPARHFVGRLATYKYYNMDQVVAQSLALCARMQGVERAFVSARAEASEEQAA